MIANTSPSCRFKRFAGNRNLDFNAKSGGSYNHWHRNYNHPIRFGYRNIHLHRNQCGGLYLNSIS